jgi:hypothetical protein
MIREHSTKYLSAIIGKIVFIINCGNDMKKQLLLFLLFFLPFLSYAQIEIREEVILNPSLSARPV